MLFFYRGKKVLKIGLKMKLAFLSLLVVIAGFSAYMIFIQSESTPITAKAEENSKTVTIYLAGDSTVSDYPTTIFPRTGWGQMLPAMFDEQVKIRNYAKPGRSSKSFIREGRLNWILNSIQKGDYLFIQFGHNDAKYRYQSLYTNPNTTYKTNLKKYIEGAREKGAFPVLITPVQKMSFSDQGIALETHGRYPDAMKALAREENVPLIDLSEMSKSLYQQLGPVQTKKLFLWLKPGEYPNFPDGARDAIHFQKYGAEQIAQLVVKGIEELHLPIEENILSKER